MKASSRVPLLQLQKTAIQAAHAGGQILMKHFGKKLKIAEKKGAGLVTNADLESEEKVIRILKRPFSSFRFLTEETHPNDRLRADTQGRWIVDPLDGTTNYVHRFPMFCVSIAAEWEGEIVVGVIYHPVLKETYVAVKGKGARLDGKKLQVAQNSRLEDSLLTTGFTYRKDEGLHTEMEAFERLSGVARAVRRPGSAALDLAYTARGVFDGFWERRLSPWDIAAGALLVEEAGGRVTNFKGDRFKVNDAEILAASSALYPSLLKAVATRS